MIYYELLECLSALPKELLLKIAHNIGISPGREIIPSIHKTLTNKETILSIIHSLPSEAKDLLQYSYVNRYRLNSLEESKIIKNPSFKLLSKCGLYFTGKHLNGTLQIVLPLENENYIRDAIVNHIQSRLNPVSTSDVMIANGDRFIRNATTMLMLVENSPFPLTKENDLNSKHIEKNVLPLLEKINGDEKATKFLKSFELMCRFLFYFSILDKNENSVIPGYGKIAWLEADETLQAKALSYYFSLSSENFDLLLDILKLNGENWIYVDELFGLFWKNPKKGDAKSFQRIIMPLFITGLVNLGIENDKITISTGTLILENTQGFSEDKFIISPDFKIFSPRKLKPSVKLELGKMAKLIKSDMMDQWELNSETISNAADNGYDECKITEFLSKHNSKELPKNVFASIKIWINEAVKIRRYNGTVLIINNDSVTLNYVKDIIMAENALILQPSENVFLLSKEKADKIIEQLSKRRKISIIHEKREIVTKSNKLDKIIENINTSLTNEKVKKMVRIIY